MNWLDWIGDRLLQRERTKLPTIEEHRQRAAEQARRESERAQREADQVRARIERIELQREVWQRGNR